MDLTYCRDRDPAPFSVPYLGFSFTQSVSHAAETFHLNRTTALDAPRWYISKWGTHLFRRCQQGLLESQK